MRDSRGYILMDTMAGLMLFLLFTASFTKIQWNLGRGISEAQLRLRLASESAALSFSAGLNCTRSSRPGYSVLHCTSDTEKEVTREITYVFILPS